MKLFTRVIFALAALSATPAVAGPGQLRFVRRGVVVVVPPPTAAYSYDTAMGTGVDSTTGYTQLPLRAGANRYFVNSSTGSDSNTCTQALSAATPKATAANAYNCLTDGQGDHLAFAQDTTFSEGLPTFNLSGFSPAYPVTYESYDPADPTNTAKYGLAQGNHRPVFTVAGLMTCCQTVPKAYLAIRGVKISPPDVGDNSLQFVSSNALSPQYILIENNVFAHSELRVVGDIRDKIKGLVVRANMLYGTWSTNGASTAQGQGFYLEAIGQGTVEDNTFWHVGYKVGASRDANVSAGGLDNGGGVPNVYRHSLYMQDTSDLIIRRNAFLDPGITGCSCRGMADVQKNFVSNAPISIINGLGVSYLYYRPTGEWGFTSQNAVFGDADINAVDGLSAARGLAYRSGNGALGTQVRYNLAARSRFQSTNNVFADMQASYDSPASYANYHDNVEYAWADPTTVLANADSSPSGASIHRTTINNYWSIPDGNTLSLPHGADFAHWDGLLTSGQSYRFRTDAITKTEGINLAFNDGTTNMANFAVTNGVAIDQTFTATASGNFRILASGDNFTGVLPNVRLTLAAGGSELLGGTTPTVGGNLFTWTSYPNDFNISHRPPVNAYTAATLYAATGLSGVTDEASFITAIMDKPELRPARILQPILMAGYNVPVPVAGDLQFSRIRPFIHNQPWVGNIMGTIDGSTLSSSDLPSGTTMDGPGRRLTFDGSLGVGTYTFHITETPATGSPRTSTMTETVLGSPTLANLTIAAGIVSGTPGTVAVSGVYGSYSDSYTQVTGGSAAAHFSIGPDRTLSYDGTTYTAGSTVQITEWLTGATNSPHVTTITLP